MQCQCNKGRNLNQSGATVDQLKLMVAKRELAIVKNKHRALYNTLPEVLTTAFDQCQVNMEYIKKWFTLAKCFNPNFASG